LRSRAEYVNGHRQSRLTRPHAATDTAASARDTCGEVIQFGRVRRWL
jgi:hypothetical protein